MDNNLQSNITTIVVGLIAAAFLIFIKGWKVKDGKSRISSSTFFLLGFIFTPLGIASLLFGADGMAFFVLGSIYLIIGLILNKKHK